jgi:CheY-like chemotaxis protein
MSYGYGIVSREFVFFQRALDQLLFTGVYRRVGDVEDAIDYLSGHGQFSNRRLFPLPDVMVLDTSLPGTKDTGELMTWIKERPAFSNLVKVVLSGGLSVAAEQRWFEEGITGILHKGLSIADMARSVEEILQRCG